VTNALLFFYSKKYRRLQKKLFERLAQAISDIIHKPDKIPILPLAERCFDRRYKGNCIAQEMENRNEKGGNRNSQGNSRQMLGREFIGRSALGN